MIKHGKWFVIKKYLFLRLHVKAEQAYKYFKGFLINIFNKEKYIKNRDKNKDLRLKNRRK